MTRASAHAKVVLAGEHAVVYGQPAVAMPLHALACEVTIADSPDGLTTFVADAFEGRHLAGAAQDHPLSFLEGLLDWLFRDELPRFGVALAQHGSGRVGHPPLTVTVRSAIPLGAGLGSSAAILVAATRALFAHYGVYPSAADIQRLAHTAEMGVHGRSSGLDVAASLSSGPLLFTTGTPVHNLVVGAPFDLLIARSGRQSSTRQVVLELLERRKVEGPAMDDLFAKIGEVSRELAPAIEQGDLRLMGRLFDRNHDLLVDLGVSCPELEGLVQAARQAGALGAKLTGAGRGGCMVGVAELNLGSAIRRALLEAGAVEVYECQVLPSPQPIGRVS